MSKTIDVMEGDEWGMLQSGDIVQYRHGQWRLSGKDRNVGRWCFGLQMGAPPIRDRGEIELTEVEASAILRAWGYTLTPAAKPEAKPVPVPKHGPCDLSIANAGEARLDNGSTVKPELTVPLVDAVWVDHEGTLYQYASHARAEQAWGERLTNGTARIVRIRNVDDEARDEAATAQSWAIRAERAIAALESRLAADKPADKPAARVVLPKCPQPTMAVHAIEPSYQAGWNECLLACRTALTSQGITIADEGSKT